MNFALQIKRIYDAPSADDGTRVLVDRLWPRGVTKQAAALDLWFKDVAPTSELRKWFAHDPENWQEFQKRYRAELRQNDVAIERLLDYLEVGPLTLLYAARDPEINHALVLTNYIRHYIQPHNDH